MPTLLSIFYFFAALLVVASFMVVVSRNPVHSAFFLVFAFFASAVLWLLLQAEFLALVLIFVYVGAVMTLFLFVVMMLNLDLKSLREGFVRYLPFGIVLILLLVALLVLAIGPQHFGLAFATPILRPENYNNTRMLGAVLYTDYLYSFEIAGVLLLVAIVAAISLVFRHVANDKAQKIEAQIAVRPEDRIQLVKMRAKQK